ncbi:TonB-dependent receptor [Phenylobacterium sp. LH3H17]|uniref:TonB-dependent receptor domain-containing protein n=1 Tax=Phenylobacterium sp. LH3H17 TaxID=2903901 RepID=UPI0020C97785|nr:TonB-dependent receptor [Phenylobacterium sp. LH3H17]UTP39853.1 TonB-dependent receptor [Phenylobacterium sp. LH3H17]
MRPFLSVSVSLAVACLAGPAFGQATANAVVGADDAFGFIAGDEAVGIYDATAVRGFSLEAAGNYRVNGGYFVKSSGVSSFFIESTTVRIGLNALAIDLPGPSGVVDYKIRDPKPGEASYLTLGLDEYEQPYADLLLKHGDGRDRHSGALGLGVVFDNDNGQGGPSGRSMLLGGTARVSLGAVRLQVFGGEYDYERGGLYRFTVADGAHPPRPERGARAVQDWAVERGQRRILGVMVQAPLSEAWSLGLTGAFSQEDPSRAVAHLYRGLDGDLTARGVAFVSPAQEASAWSGEARLAWGGRWEDTRHRLTLIGRGRLSDSRFGGDRIVDLGTVSLGGRLRPVAAPDLSAARANATSEVDQWGLGLSYRLDWRDALTVNAGLLRTDYDKTSIAADGLRSARTATPWLYNLAGAYRVTDRLDLYGGVSRGLEEAGTAPASAANRNELLPAIRVRQVEAGMRYAVSAGMRLVVAAFETEKPYAGLDTATNAYGLIGVVRHRGVEASLAGRLSEALSVVVGGYVLDPTRDGLSGGRPVGVERFRAVANLNYVVRAMPGLSLDTGLEHVGRRPYRSAAGGVQPMLAADTTLDLGLRYRLPGRATLRVQALNVLDDYGYSASPAETLAYTAPRRFRVLVTKEF